jgi:hypothetical protein
MRTIFYSLVTLLAFVPIAVFAQEDDNKNLVNLPIGDTDSFNDYINAVYLMFISIAALIAVVKIIIAGVKYMFTDIVTQKGEALNDIKGALLGLLIILSAVVVLTIINPDLTTFDPDITAVERRERSAVTNNSLTDSDKQRVKDFMLDNRLANATTQSCTYFDSNKALGWIGSALAPVDGLLNAATCKVWCDGLKGEIVGKKCLYDKDFDQKELVESVIKDSGYCDEAGCETLDCAFFRTEGSCTSWCDNRGGVNIETSYLFTTQQCLVAMLPLEKTTVIDCEADGSTTDCRAATSLCELSGGSPSGQTNASDVLEISCTPLGREVFACQQIGPGQYDCDSAKIKCTGARTATVNNKKDVVCE